MYFAQDPIDMAAAEKFLAEAFAREPGLHWIALIDGAFDHGRGAAGVVYEGLNCYAAEHPLNDLVDTAPWLIDLNPFDKNDRNLAKLLAHCTGRPMFSVVASRIPASLLGRRWRPLHQVHTSDSQLLLLRFADTRTLPVLSDVLGACAVGSNYGAPGALVLSRSGRDHGGCCSARSDNSCSVDGSAFEPSATRRHGQSLRAGRCTGPAGGPNVRSVRSQRIARKTARLHQEKNFRFD
jgi:hypothetical protein